MDSEDMSYLGVKYNPQRNTLRVQWRGLGDEVDSYRMFKLDQ